MSNILSRLGNIISFVSKKIQSRINYAKTLQVVSLKPKQPSKGNVLLSYRIEPFLLKPGQSMPNDHTWYWEVWQIATNC